MDRKDLLNLLLEKDLTLSCMESLTAGLFAASFTSVPGASNVFLGGGITYNNDVKKAFGIKPEIINTYGAISKECADEMALQCAFFFKSDIAISFTGNAGPSAEEDKTVGLVFISIKLKDTLYSYKLNLKGEREDIRRQCVDFAFNKIYTLVKENA